MRQSVDRRPHQLSVEVVYLLKSQMIIQQSCGDAGDLPINRECHLIAGGILAEQISMERLNSASGGQFFDLVAVGDIVHITIGHGGIDGSDKRKRLSYGPCPLSDICDEGPIEMEGSRDSCCG